MSSTPQHDSLVDDSLIDVARRKSVNSPSLHSVFLSSHVVFSYLGKFLIFFIYILNSQIRFRCLIASSKL